ncbi:hypothetical protein, partial [Pseudanabaena sp. CCNP1317]|uniref:hypothetical protein n=1 Tax=Pseudanabaena sp. CCNP1317 TaxID=3110253 RepID=UPI002B1F70E6
VSSAPPGSVKRLASRESGRPARLVATALRCAADADSDGVIGFSDLNAVLSAFGQTGVPGALAGDINADGVVGFADLNAVLGAFGTECE